MSFVHFITNGAYWEHATNRWHESETVMPRRKSSEQILSAAHAYIQACAPELQEVPIMVRMLDGPPDAPHFSVSVEKCSALGNCPYSVSPEVAACGKCPIAACQLRCSMRLLLDRSGTVVQVLRGNTHWS